MTNPVMQDLTYCSRHLFMPDSDRIFFENQAWHKCLFCDHWEIEQGAPCAAETESDAAFFRGLSWGVLFDLAILLTSLLVWYCITNLFRVMR